MCVRKVGRIAGHGVWAKWHRSVGKIKPRDASTIGGQFRVRGSAEFEGGSAASEDAGPYAQRRVSVSGRGRCPKGEWADPGSLLRRLMHVNLWRVVGEGAE